jgi:hypothetical protein
VTRHFPRLPRLNLSEWLAVLFLALSLAVAVGVRVRLLDFPLERDEGEYAYAGQLILQGIPPYQLAYNMKLPGTYLAYAVLMSIFGQTPTGIHLGLLAVHLATLATLFLIARKIIDLQGAAIATAAYALMTLSPAYTGLAAHATHFVVLPTLLGTWMLLCFEKSARLWKCLAAGCLFGIAFVMKQPGVCFGLFGGLYLAWLGMGGKTGWRRTLAQLAIYSLGCVLPFLAVCLWLKIAGVFPQFWFWTVTYARDYVTIVSFERLEDAWSTIAPILQAAPLIWIIAGLGLACLCFERLALNTRIFLAGLLAFSFLAVCPGLYFRPHYFIVLVPAVALLTGLAVSWSARRLAEKGCPPWLRHLPVVFAALACAESLYTDRAVFFSLPPLEACREVYGVNPFPEARDLARYIEQNTGKDQGIAVIGSEPEIFFYAHRHSVTPQIYAYPLMEPQPYAVKMQEDMIHDLKQNPPDYLVFVSNHLSWLERPDSSHALLDWLASYLPQNMQLVGMNQLTSLNTSETVWGPKAATTPLRSNCAILIYRRKELQPK